MELGEYISKYRKQAGLTIDELASASGVPKGTINKIIAGTTKSPTLETVQSLAFALGKSINDFMDTPTKTSVSAEELERIKKYRSLDADGQEAVDVILDVEHKRCMRMGEKKQENETAAKSPVVVLRQPYTQVAAAEGSGAFLLDDGYEEVAVQLNRSTQQADVILKVVGRSMEPVIHDGDRIIVRMQPSIRVGEIGVFIIDGEGYLKEYAPDRLISLNPDIEDVFIRDQQTAECYGKFIGVLNPEWVVN